MINRIKMYMTSLLVGSTMLVGGAALADQGGMYGQSDDQWMSDQRPQMQMRSIQGTVERTKTVRLRGSSERNLVAMIRTPDNRRLVVDLGPRDDARQLGLQPGDQLRARGGMTQIRGRTVFIAMDARAGGERLSIDRSRQRQFMRAMHGGQMGMCPQMGS